MRPPKLVAVLLSYALCVSATASAGDAGDTVFLKNGGRVRGIVMEEDPVKGVRVKMSDGQVRQLSAGEIDHVVYEGDATAPAPTGEESQPPTALAPAPPATPSAPAADPVPALSLPPPPQPTSDEPELSRIGLGAAANLSMMLVDGEDVGYWLEGNFVLRLNLSRLISVELGGGPVVYGWSEDETESTESGFVDTTTNHLGYGVSLHPLLVFNVGRIVLLKGGPVLGYAATDKTGGACAYSTGGALYGGTLEGALRLGRKVELGVQASYLNVPKAGCYEFASVGSSVSDSDYYSSNDGALLTGVRAAFMFK